MRKSLIITAALMVSSLFAGTALADDTTRGTEKPSLRADRSDGAKAYADKLRERNEVNSRSVTTSRATPNKIERHRPKGDMVDQASRPKAQKDNATNTSSNRGKALVNRTVAEKRADIQDRAKKSSRTDGGNKRAFTVANDRHANRDNNGPKTIVDVMARRELLKFLGAAGVKINCQQTGTCTESPI